MKNPLYLLFLVVVTLTQMILFEEAPVKLPPNSYRFKAMVGDVFEVYCSWDEVTNIDIFVFTDDQKIIYTFDNSIYESSSSDTETETFTYLAKWDGNFYFTLKLQTTVDTDYNFTLLQNGVEMIQDLSRIATTDSTFVETFVNI